LQSRAFKINKNFAGYSLSISRSNRPQSAGQEICNGNPFTPLQTLLTPRMGTLLQLSICRQPRCTLGFPWHDLSEWSHKHFKPSRSFNCSNSLRLQLHSREITNLTMNFLMRKNPTCTIPSQSSFSPSTPTWSTARPLLTKSSSSTPFHLQPWTNEFMASTNSPKIENIEYTAPELTRDYELSETLKRQEKNESQWAPWLPIPRAQSTRLSTILSGHLASTTLAFSLPWSLFTKLATSYCALQITMHTKF